jgi:hypothetical protein
MKKTFPLLSLILGCLVAWWPGGLTAQNLIRQWDITFGTSGGGGGSPSETTFGLLKDKNNHFYIIGTAESTDGDAESIPERIPPNYWLIKVNNSGNVLWKKLIGGNRGQIAYAGRFNQDTSVLFICGAGTSDISGDRTEPNYCTWNDNGSISNVPDYWVVQTDLDGNVLRSKAFSGICDNQTRGGGQIGKSIYPTADGGYIVAGDANSLVGNQRTEPKHSNGAGDGDVWMIKVDAAGNQQWDKTIGTFRHDSPGYNTVQQTSDGGYIIGAYTNDLNLNFEKTCQNNWLSVNADIWLIKTDPNGQPLWDFCFGEEGNDYINGLLQLPDGGFLLIGESNSNEVGGTKSEPSRGGTDGWVIRTDANGTALWDKTFGGPLNDHLVNAIPYPDGSFILVGRTMTGAGGDKSDIGYGNNDAWVIKIDANGNKIWDKIYGTSGDDGFRCVVATPDTGLMLGGYSNGPAELDKSQPSRGGPRDLWVLKLKPTQPLALNRLELKGRLTDRRVILHWTMDSDPITIQQFRVIRYRDQNGYALAESTFILSIEQLSLQTAPDGSYEYQWTDQPLTTGIVYYQVIAKQNEDQLSSRLIQITIPQRESACTIYPNPAQETITIRYPVQDHDHLTLLDITGRELLSFRLNRSGEHTFDVSILPEGIYILKVSDRFSEKLVVVR